MDNFNLKQYLIESKIGMYSKALIKEGALENADTLGKEIAKQHPELLDFKLNGETKKYQDAIFKYAGELLRDAGVPLQTTRGLAYDEDWAMELVSAVGDELQHKDGGLKEMNPAALGAQQDVADAGFDKEEDQNNGAYQDDAELGEQIGVAYANKEAPAETGLNKYLDLIHRHDWFHHFSDDPRAWRQGQTEKEEMKALYSALSPAEKQTAMDAFTDKYLEIHDPKQFPNAANNVKYLTTDTFKGAF
jgi:hypothetical protein